MAGTYQGKPKPISGFSSSDCLPVSSQPDDIEMHLPKPYQIMAEIKRQAHAEVAEIVASIARGETTLAEVIRKRT